MGKFICKSNRCLPKWENNKRGKLGRYLLLAISGKHMGIGSSAWRTTSIWADPGWSRPAVSKPVRANTSSMEVQAQTMLESVTEDARVPELRGSMLNHTKTRALRWHRQACACVTNWQWQLTKVVSAPHIVSNKIIPMLCTFEMIGEYWQNHWF